LGSKRGVEEVKGCEEWTGESYARAGDCTSCAVLGKPHWMIAYALEACRATSRVVRRRDRILEEDCVAAPGERCLLWASLRKSLRAEGSQEPYVSTTKGVNLWGIGDSVFAEEKSLLYLVIFREQARLAVARGVDFDFCR